MRAIIKALTATFAVGLIVVGLIVFLMPIPLGALMMAAGLILLISVSASAALRLKLFRGRHRGLNSFIRKIEDRLPESLKKVLRRTDP